jgi:hypothetical protein
MVPQLARAVDAYGIEVVSSGGFESTTEKHDFAAALVDQGRPTEVLHIGHDPSGAHLVGGARRGRAGLCPAISAARSPSHGSP